MKLSLTRQQQRKLDLSDAEIEALLDWTEGDVDAPECGDDLCFVCSARTKLEASLEED